MTDKQIIYYKKDCFNEQYCSLKEVLEELSRKTQECEELKKQLKNFCFDCDVAERMRKVTYAATGGRLSYANYTVEAIEQAYNDQLYIDVEYRTKELQNELDQLKAENETYQKILDNPEVRVALTDIRTGERDLWQKYKPRMEKAEQKLERIKNICHRKTEGLYPRTNPLKEILQIIDEVE